MKYEEKKRNKDPPIFKTILFHSAQFNSKYINKIYFFNYCNATKKYTYILYIYI